MHERGHGCRLSLTGVAHGDGPTLQRAADDLVARVVKAALALRGGLPFCSALPPPDPGVLGFLQQVADRVARREDVRDLILRESP